MVRQVIIRIKMFLPKNLTRFRTFENLSKRCLSTQERNFKEVSIKVPWGQISGKWWEPYDSRPILTLHGWQDNCGSFDRLIPMLNQNVGFLSVDFPGHGYSSRLPLGIYYHYSTYILTIKSIINYFKWSKISLMGHSLGGIISYVYTMLYTKEVDFLVCLDGAKPMIPLNKNVYLGKNLELFFKYNSQAADSDSEPPSYTMEELIHKICQPNNKSVSPESAKYIIERNIAPSKLHAGKFYVTRDPRLKSNDTTGFCQDELIQYAQNMTPPIFIAKFKNGSYYEVKENFYQVLDVLKRTSSDCDFNYVEGTHHAHLNNPEDVAGLVSNFIRKHNIEDRSVGGITNEIIVDNNKTKLKL